MEWMRSSFLTGGSAHTYILIRRIGVLTFSKLRKNAPEVEGAIIDLNDLTEWLRPAMHVHIGEWPTMPD